VFQFEDFLSNGAGGCHTRRYYLQFIAAPVCRLPGEVATTRARGTESRRHENFP